MNTGNESIGVVLCTYNGAKYLKAQLESIVAQTLRPNVIHILDDASTDRTIFVVQDFVKATGANVALHCNSTNLGYAKNFEQGISLCETNFIAFSDQDDIWHPNKLETLVAMLKNSPESCIAFGNAEFLTADGMPTGEYYYPLEFGFARNIDEGRLKLLDMECVPGNFMVMNAHYKPLLFPIPDGCKQLAHDRWLCLNGAFKYSAVWTGEPLGYYRIHPEQASGAFSFVLKGTKFEYKKPVFSLQRLKKSLIRLVMDPLTRTQRHKKRREVDYLWALHMKNTLDQCNTLSNPERYSEQTNAKLRLKYAKWNATIESYSRHK